MHSSLVRIEQRAPPTAETGREATNARLAALEMQLSTIASMLVTRPDAAGGEASPSLLRRANTDPVLPEQVEQDPIMHY